MKYNQINEAIIKVPQELLSKVNLYVSSVLAYKLRKYSERMDMLMGNNTTPEEKQKIQSDIKQTIAKLQQKYGAKNLTPESYAQIDNSVIPLSINFDTFFKELNYKGITPEMVEYVKSYTKLRLHIANGSSESAGSVTNEGRVVTVMIHIGRFNPRDSLNSANAILRTVYHECQHVVQDFAIKTIQNSKPTSKTNKQLDHGENYGDGAEGYYTSGVEYTPQLGDVINTINDILERDAMQGKLDSKINRAINNAIADAYQEDGKVRHFLGYQRKSNPAGYQKALKAIYSKVAPVYHSLQQNGVDYRYSDLEPEVLESNIDVLATILQMLRKKSEYFKIGGKQKGDDIMWLSMISKKHGWEIIVAPRFKGVYQVSFNYEQYDEQQSLNSQQLLNFIGIVTDSTYYDAEDVLSTLDSYVDAGEDVSESTIESIIERMSSDAEYMEVPFKDLGNGQFNVAGLVLSLKIDEDNKSNIVFEDSSGELYFTLPPLKLISLLQSFIRACVNNTESAKEILLDFSSYIEKINKLRNI